MDQNPLDQYRRQLIADVISCAGPRVNNDASYRSSELNGHHITIRRSAGSDVTVVTMRFVHPVDVDRPNTFQIRRSNEHPTLVTLNDGDPSSVEAVATELVDVFIQQAERLGR